MSIGSASTVASTGENKPPTDVSSGGACSNLTLCPEYLISPNPAEQGVSYVANGPEETRVKQIRSSPGCGTWVAVGFLPPMDMPLGVDTFLFPFSNSVLAKETNFPFPL
jgi:hypothetical protein